MRISKRAWAITIVGGFLWVLDGMLRPVGWIWKGR